MNSVETRSGRANPSSTARLSSNETRTFYLFVFFVITVIFEVDGKRLSVEGRLVSDGRICCCDFSRTNFSVGCAATFVDLKISQPSFQ